MSLWVPFPGQNTERGRKDRWTDGQTDTDKQKKDKKGHLLTRTEDASSPTSLSPYFVTPQQGTELQTPPCRRGAEEMKLSFATVCCGSCPGSPAPVCSDKGSWPFKRWSLEGGRGQVTGKAGF